MECRMVLAGLGLLASVWLPGVAAAENLVMPRELVEHAQAHGCRPVADFDTQPGVFGQPFVHGYVPGSKQASAVYWCEYGPEERPVFRLMLTFEDQRHELARCPHSIEWGARIGGLSIQNDDTITLDRFVPLDHRARRPPKGTRLDHPAIRSEGADVVFYCHQGWWYVQLGP
jgi:hypothetical protein